MDYVLKDLLRVVAVDLTSSEVSFKLLNNSCDSSLLITIQKDLQVCAGKGKFRAAEQTDTASRLRGKPYTFAHSQCSRFLELYCLRNKP